MTGAATTIVTCPAELQTEVRKDLTIPEKVPTRAFSWLKVPTSVFTFKTLLRQYAKQASKHIDMKLGCQR